MSKSKLEYIGFDKEFYSIKESIEWLHEHNFRHKDKIKKDRINHLFKINRIKEVYSREKIHKNGVLYIIAYSKKIK